MSNANKIIKENDFEALKEKIKTLDIVKLMRITKKAINKSRPACFHLILEYSIKFANKKGYNYQEEYLNPVFMQGANNNALYVLENIIKSPYFDNNKIDLSEYFESYNLHERITYFLKDNFDLSKLNIEHYESIIKQIREKNGKLIPKNKKNIDSLINICGFDTEDFLSFMFEYKKEREQYFTSYKFSQQGLLSFLENYIEYNKIHKFKEFFSEEDKIKYEKNIIKYKMSDF